MTRSRYHTEQTLHESTPSPLLSITPPPPLHHPSSPPLPLLPSITPPPPFYHHPPSTYLQLKLYLEESPAVYLRDRVAEGEEEGGGREEGMDMVTDVCLLPSCNHIWQPHTSSCFGMRCPSAISTFSSWVYPGTSIT